MTQNSDGNNRIIKRYGNRKLYDTELSRYVTIEEVANHIRNGISVKIIDNKSGEDITNTTLAQIVLEAEKKNRHKTSSSVLESIIKTGTLSDFVITSRNSVKSGIVEAEKWFSQLVDNNKSFWSEIKGSLKKTNKPAKFEDFGERMESHFRTTIEKIKHNSSRDKIITERELLSLRQKVMELEERLKKYEEEKRRMSDE
ncbi:MAG: polyhydroxyalkanoate synthesis regulator DNA-binding domain-containing protein [Oligoflexia bacterium]|nr:polyhydroxyalkanoate synthesis regulator DNA-binding domain-containing protein [Oligoflexia bacterium]